MRITLSELRSSLDVHVSTPRSVRIYARAGEIVPNNSIYFISVEEQNRMVGAEDRLPVMVVEVTDEVVVARFDDGAFDVVLVG